MQELKEVLIRSDAEQDTTKIANIYSSLFKYLSNDVSSISLNHSVSSIEVSQRGVDYITTCDDSQSFISILPKEDTYIEVFGKTWNIRRRGDAIVIYSNNEPNYNLDSSLISKMESFLVSVTSGSGISFVGSQNIMLTIRLIDLIAKNLPESSCNVYYDGSNYVMSEYDTSTNRVINTTTKDNLNEILSCVALSPYKYVFVEGCSGFDSVMESVNLSIKGKRVIYGVNSISSVYALYSAMQAVDAQVLSPLFSGALFVDNLAYVKGASLPKLAFESHQSFGKWGALKTSPTREELVLIDPKRGLLDVSRSELLLTECITPSKAVSKWIGEKVNPLDFASNLRLDQCWVSIADEAAIAVRDESVTFDQVLRKISLI